MQVDPNYGIIIDNQPTILNNYIVGTQSVFPDANSADSPAYMLMYQASLMDFTNEHALQVLWNAINSNTAQGVGLDILCDTILNIQRRGLIPSSASLDVTISGLQSSLVVTINTTSTGSGPKLVAGTTLTMGASPSAPYTLAADFNLPVGTATSLVTFYSTDLVTPVPSSSVTALATHSPTNATVNTITNVTTAVLGSLTVPSGWSVTAGSISNSPVYSTNQDYTFNTNAVQNIIVYSNDIGTNILALQLNSPSSNFGGLITSVVNPYDAVLGAPIESDQQLSARRRYYLNVAGQTYYGIEQAIIDLQIPALRSVFVPETITDSLNVASLVIQMTISGASGGSPVVIPVNWAVTVSTGSPPSPAFKTLTAYSFTTNTTHYVMVYTTDNIHPVAIGDVTGGDTITGVSAVSNITPSLTGTPGGERGYTMYLDYPLLNSGYFDTNDIYLQQIAQTAYGYHPFGTQFYPAMTGATAFTVKTAYGNFTSTVYLNPMQYTRTSAVLTLYYTTDPEAAGYSGKVFPATELPNLKQEVLDIINAYFQSKTLPTDLTYSINEVSQLIQSAYTGIISLSGFTFGLPGVPSTGLQFLTRAPGELFQVAFADFTFTATDVA